MLVKSRVSIIENRLTALFECGLLALLLLHANVAVAQVTSTETQRGGQSSARPEQLSGKDPNVIPATIFRLVDSVRSTKSNGYGAPIKLWEKGCRSARCELRSRIDQDTQLYDRQGALKSIKTLKAHKNYTAISVRFDDRGSGRLESIYLMPKRR